MRHPRAEPDTETLLGRFTLILRSFDTERSTLSVADLVERTGIPRATIHRQANALADFGWLTRNGTRFELGLGAFELGQQVPVSRDLRDVATPFMADLRGATGLTVNLAVLDGRDVVYVELLRGRNAPTILRRAKIGGRLPAHVTGLGKALLAYSDQEVLDTYIEQGLEPFGPRTIRDPGLLRGTVEDIRRAGIAYDREGSVSGVLCAAAPIFAGQRHELAAAISIAGLGMNISLDQVSVAVRTTAATVSRVLEGPKILVARKGD